MPVVKFFLICTVCLLVPGLMESGHSSAQDLNADPIQDGQVDPSSTDPKTDTETKSKDKPEQRGVRIVAPRKLDLQFGMKIKANDNFCTNLFATIAFPTDWPEQKVQVKQSNIPANAQWQYRDLPQNAPPSARQLVMSIPALGAGGELDLLFEVEVEKSFIEAPEDTSVFVIPKKLNKELNWFMGNSPMIDANASDIKRIAKSIKDSKPESAWSHVEKIYDWVRENIEIGRAHV